MPASIMVLGPSAWTDPSAPHALPVPPLEARRGLASLMRRRGASAFVLEDRRKAVEEDDFSFFERVGKEEDVRTFAVLWPAGARLHGLNVELGHLLTRLSLRSLAPDDVPVLAEARVVAIDPAEAVLRFAERGNRTRYHQALVARGCPVRRWSGAAALRRLAAGVAEEHLARHAP